MRIWWFPDNTVLCSFAAVGRLDLLEKVLANRGRWTEAVAYETRRSARVIPLLSSIFREGWLSDPIEVSGEREALGVDVIRRRVFGGRASEPLKHLGEAQTLYLLQNSQQFRASLWLTDDREAFEYAKRQNIIARSTVDIVKIAVADGLISALDGYALLQVMIGAGRHLHGMPRNAAELAR